MQNISGRIADLFQSVLDYALPYMRWIYHGQEFDNGEMAQKCFPLILRQTAKWLGADALAWGIGTQIIIEKESPYSEMYTCKSQEDVCLGPVLLFCLDVAMYAHAKASYADVVPLDFLDNPVSILERQGYAKRTVF